MYTYTLRKKLSVELNVVSGAARERFGKWDKPHIFTLQRVFTGFALEGRPGSRGDDGGGTPLCVHLFFGAWAVRGGVTGRPELTPPYWYLAFFSEGFKILKTQGDNKWGTAVRRVPAYQRSWTVPGRSTWGIRLRSSCRLHCQTPRSSLEQKRA